MSSRVGVRIRLIHLDEALPPDWPHILSADEHARAAKFHFDVHRHRFIAGRVALRRVLARELEIDPAEVAIVYGPHGKPALDDRHDAAVTFNVSHSHDVALIALARRTRLGIDVERMHAMADMARVADTVFTVRERLEWKALTGEDRVRGFFAAWTRKEAYIKALGDGLQHPLQDFEVPIAPDAPPRLLHVAHSPDEVHRWSFAEITGIEGCLATLCVEGPLQPIDCDWRPAAARLAAV